MIRRALILLFVATAARAQYVENFQSYGTQANPPGWVDTSVGASKPEAKGLFKTWPDPLQSTNIVYGEQSSTPKSTAPIPRVGTFSTLTKTFAGSAFEFRGRFLRTSADTRVGVTFFSSYPEQDRYYLAGLWQRANGSVAMQLFSYGAGALSGVTDSNVTPDVNRWYRFAINADNTGNATRIRARFWRDGETEPATWSIDATDASPQRLTSGRIGMWSAVKGDAYVDDLSVVTNNAQTITFLDGDTGSVLNPATLALFKKPARIDVRVDTGGVPPVTLDGNPYVPLTPIAAEGMHTLVAGNATLRLLVDTKPPAVELLVDGAPGNVTLSARVTDVSETTLAATLDGVVVDLPLVVTQEKLHTISATAEDRVGWTSTASSTFVVDKTAPVIAISANGAELISGSAFSQSVTLTWTISDLTLDNVTATLDGNAVTSGVVVDAQASHTLVVTASDKAAHTTSVTRTFVVDRFRPEVRILANGQPFSPGKAFAQPVAFTFEIQSASTTTTEAKVDGAVGQSVATEGAHTIAVRVTNAAGLVTELGPFPFVIDVTKPTITIAEFPNKLAHDFTPVVTATDNLASSPKTQLLLDGHDYPIGTAITSESIDHTIEAIATDDAGNTATSGVRHFTLDKTKPIVTVDAIAPIVTSAVTLRITVADLTRVTVAATLNGAPLALTQSGNVWTSAPIAADNVYDVAIVATDDVGLSNDPVTLSFRIDTTGPEVAFTAPAANALLAVPLVRVEGTCGDATSVTVNGRTALVDLVTKTFIADDIALLEGRNELVTVAKDASGNATAATLVVDVDTRAPELAIASTAANACFNASQAQITGRANDAHLASVIVANVAATRNADGTWTATVPLGAEGRVVLTVTATDAAGHASVLTLPIEIDRTRPAIEITESGAPFAGGSINRAVAPNVRVLDGPSTLVTTTLNGNRYDDSTIAADGAYTLHVSARDCAGNTSDAEVAFTIDRAAPHIVSLDPADGSTIGAARAINGTLDADDVQSVTIEGTSVAAAITGRNFTLDAPLAGGINRLALTATDRAGNSSTRAYAITLKSSTPLVEILENGSPIPASALFARAIAPVIRANESDAAIAATLDGAAFASGTTITANGAHTIRAIASDAFGHTSPEAVATFTIDTIAPSIQLTSPVNGATLETATVAVSGTAAGADSLTINGVAAALANGSFTTTIALESGPNAIVAVAYDRAGNSAVAQIEVTRGDGRPGILITSPANNMLTNRGTTTVAGQLLTADLAASVTINGVNAPVDAAGAFRMDDFALHEGDNAITVAVAGKSATVHVNADFTPPALTVLANGAELSSGASFETSPAITLQATDTNPGVTTSLRVDGTSNASAFANGGHALVAIATDAAGNQTRIERTFFVGAAGAAAGCALSAFDPPDRAAIFANSVRLTGRSGGAAKVLVNGATATLDSGSFAISVPLPVEGANAISIACDPSTTLGTGGNAPVTLTLYRYTNAPSITIDVLPAVLTSTTVTVHGTVGDGVVSGDVNGIAFTPINGTYSVANVSLTKGLNVITARAKNGAGRIGIATRSVIVANAAPQLAITSPLPSTETGAATIDVSGTYANADPSTIAIAGATVTPHPTSDTTGTFIAAAVPLTIGQNTITASARNAAASVDVTRISGPSIAIAAPLDNAFYPSTTTELAITGTIAAGEGSTVQVNGVAAAVSGAQFTATIPFATTVIARVTTPDAKSSSDSIRVTKLAALAIERTFPEPNAAAVDLGAAIVVLFTNPIDGATTNAITLVDDANHPITGSLFTDNDAVSFAPHVPLEAGHRYTLTVTQALKDLAGNSLASPFTLAFTTASTAPSAPPQVDQSDDIGCFATRTITGTASIAGARVRLDLDGVPSSTITGADRRFTFTFGFSGQPGFHIARVREVGIDGSLSPETTVAYRINCTGPAVASATLDRAQKKLTIRFSRPMDPATLTPSAIVLATNGNALAGNMSIAADTVTIVYASELTTSLTLTIAKSVKDAAGIALAADYVQTFPVDTQQPGGKGYISGAVYDASSGRPLENASVVITPSAGDTLATDARGRYVSPALGEGAYTIEASANGFTNAWRQVVVPAGAGVVPIDIRLTRRGGSLKHGGDTAVTKPVEATIPAAAIAPGHTVTVTAIGAQSLAGLLPLGWSPLASAEIAIDGSSTPSPIPSSKLTFTASAVDNLSLVQYDAERDEWRTVIAVAAANTPLDIDSSGNYALVYPDKTNPPPPARTGAALQGVTNPCVGPAILPASCKLESTSFTVNPTSVVPNGRTTATLVIAGSGKTWPSGTAVQAYIDEQLNLADGTTRIDPPFATDLLVYRTPSGDAGEAVFHLAPTPQAAAVTLRDGVDRVRIVEYPGRIDRGTLIGAEGGRVPGTGDISIDIPAGATLDSLHASVTPMSAADVSAFGSIAGFHVAGGFTLALTRATDTTPVTLLKPARGTFTIDVGKFATSNRQVIVAEVLGTLVRLAATTSPSTTVATGVKIFATKDVDRAQLPVDGILRDGRYLILTADAPIAFAWGRVRLDSATGLAIANARVTSSLGVADLTRAGGVFALPVPATQFALRARSLQTGDGAPASFSRAAVPDENIAFGDLILTAQPPTRVTITPDNVEVATDAFQAKATFDVDIDRASALTSFTITSAATNVPGLIDVAGPIVTFTPTAPLAAGARYTITVAPTIRSATGAPFGRTATAQFTTHALPPNNMSIHPEKIRITIPENGVSIIRGDAGALPAGAIALAVRRGRAFLEQFQAQVTAADGSFSFAAGRTATNDQIATTDAIDLQIVDSVSHAVIAVIPLTPFVSTDGLGFLAPASTASTFKTALGITISVPAGAFEMPTLIRVAPSTKSDFAAVPSLDDELTIHAAIDIQFDGRANKPLDVDIPIPPNTPTANHTFLLGRLGESSLGPRIEIDDLLRVDGTQFTTRADGTAASARLRQGVNATLTGTDVKTYLLRVVRSGKYAVTEVRTGGSTLAWAAMDGVQAGLDLFWDAFHSLFASEEYVGRGKVVVPVLAGRAFTIDGVDAATGITLFSKTYDGVPVAPVGTATGVLPPQPNAGGPYPVFGSPFSIQIVEVTRAIDRIEPLPGITVETPFATSADSGVVTVRFDEAARAGDPPRHLQVLDIRSGELSTLGTSSVTINAAVGDRLAIFIASDAVEPRAELSVIFDEAIAIPSGNLDEELRKLFVLEHDVDRTYRSIASQTTFFVDSGNRRVRIRAQLQAGGEYRLRLKKEIRDEFGGSPDLALAQPKGGDAKDLDLYFSVRRPKGDLGGAISLSRGTVRDLALDGNLLFVSALEGGLLAFDASDPANIDGTPFARAIALPDADANPPIPGQSWSVDVDHHGRVWTTAMTAEFGVVRTFRSEDFANKFGETNASRQLVEPYASGLVSWRPGATALLTAGAETEILSDRPEAVPRRMQIATQDESLVLTGGVDFDVKLAQPNPLGITGASTGVRDGFRVYTINVRTLGSTFAYLTQRISIRNETLGVRWSKDGNSGLAAPSGTNVVFDDVLVRPGDTIRIERNLATYGVVSLFGFGIGIYDLNALESNSRFAQSSPAAPAYQRLATQAAQTSAGGALTFSPDAALTASGSTLTAFALRPTSGLTPVTKNLGDPDAPVTTLDLSLVDLPELSAIKSLASAGNRPFYGRFNSIARYDAGDVRYALVSGAQYGLLVIDVTGAPQLADVIWSANGIYAVRAIGGHYATAIDGDGRSLLIDLSRIDERSLPRVDALFPSAAAALKGGVDDPRIVWQSETPAAVTTLAPAGDPDTGLLYAGTLLSKFMRVQSAIDPHVAVMVNLGRGVLTEVPSIVPLGLPTPNVISDELRPCATSGVDVEQPTACKENASLGVFRVEMTLPGSLRNALAADPQIAIESERIAGAVSEQTQEPLPPAHLRRFPLMRVLGDTTKTLRFQKGFNKFVSPWVVTIADPRVSKRYAWPDGADREGAGCFHCKLPPFVSPSNSFELYSNGRDLAVRPESAVFASTSYAYLGDDRRVFARVGTVMADTVRPTNVLTPAQSPPVATGQILETVYLHSGEVEVGAVDLDAGGRAGWNVVFDRDYRSRTFGGTALGRGWDSAIFKRLRALPTGDVEYRDGSGEVWLFRLQGNVYKAPASYFMHLLHTEQGFTLIDQKRRMTYFDELGRVTKEADEFYTPDGKGNVLRYVYDATGRLASIIDPNERRTTLTYYSDAARDGLLKSIRDWRTRAREVTYDYDAARLTSVELPKLQSVAPKRVYTYDGDANLKSIIEPNEAPAGTPRVTFTYDALDRVASQTWGTGESATFTFGPGTASVSDALKQTREYTLTQDRAHIESMKELAVPTYSGAAFGALPPSPLEALAVAPVTPKTREYRYTYTPDGQLETSTLVGVATTTYGFVSAGPELGSVVSSVSTTGGVTYAFNFRPGTAMLDSTSANGLTVQRREPDRNLLAPKETNSNIETTSEYDGITGLPTSFTSTGGTAPGGAGSKTTIEYSTATAPFKRGLPAKVAEGTDALETRYEYPDEDTTIVTDSRGVTTKTEYDSWRRPVRVTTTSTGDALTLVEEYAYDASGRLREHRRKQGSDFVTTTFEYDVIGRQTKITTDRVAVDGNPNATISESTDYSQYANGIIKHTAAGGSVTTTTLDTLGRTSKTVTTTNSSDIASVAAYDLAGNPVYSSDTKTFTSASAYDVNGRRIDALRMDGSRQHAEYDGWGRVTDLSERDRNGNEIGHHHTDYTEAGQVRSVTESGPGGARTTSTAWDGGGRTTGVATETRASVQQFDDAGRVTNVQQGQGSATGISETFSEAKYLNYGKTWLAPKVETNEPKAASTFTSSMTFDTIGNAKTTSIGSLAWSQELDQGGNVVKAKSPNRPEAAMQYDARGAVTTETLPDGATQSHEYHAAGSATGFIDPTNEATKTTADLIGRPTQVRFPDGTTQEVVYDGARVVAVKDRQDRWQSFVYAGGHVTEVWAARTPGSGALLDRIEYDDAGRVKSWTNRDSRIEYADFTFDGLPRTTKQIRYRDRKGLSNPLPSDVLDSFTQQHVYNNLGERTSYSMPATAAGWVANVTTAYDAMGNAKTITAGELVVAGEYRNAGRPIARTITLPSGKKIVRKYGYKSDTGQLNEMRVSIDDVEIAGSHVEYDGLQIADEQLLGVSANVRHTRYQYDARSRVIGSITATSTDAQPEPSVPGAVKEKLDPADFREKQERTAQLDPTVQSLLASRGVDAGTIDPPSSSATSQPGHKIATWTRGTATTNFTYNGSLRSDDDRFHYDYDEKQRLIAVTEKPKAAGSTIRRVVYAYDGNNRRIGRTAQVAQLTSLTTPLGDLPWQLEDETTFVWDPISDRLIEVIRTSDGAILKQIVHGDLAYDDPLAVLTSPTTRLFPIFDEAGGGTMQAVVNQNGGVVARTLNNDPFGGEEFSLSGPAIDNVTITATKAADGSVQSVVVTMRATEQLAASTAAAGTRLAVVDANGAILRTSAVTPRIDAYTATWTLSASDWSTLSAPTPTPASLSIAATNTLRAASWSDAPILPAPAWVTATKPVFTSAALPVEVRESLASITSLVSSLQAGEARSIISYDAPNLWFLGMAGNTAIDAAFAATFQAAPTKDPFSRLIYLRARDYDPSAGTFLQGDSLGYVDSSNLYAFTGEDPINRRDPRGEQERVPNPVRPSPEWIKPVYPPGPGTISETGVDPIPTSFGARWSLDEGPESIYKYQQLVEIWKLMDRPGAAALGGKRADQLSPKQQQAFLNHRRRLRTDPTYRLQWQKMQAAAIKLQNELHHQSAAVIEAVPPGEPNGPFAAEAPCQGNSFAYDRDRWIDKKQYGANRQQTLAEQPVCNYCQNKASTSADHVVPVKDAEAAFGAGMLTEEEARRLVNELLNLLGCCGSCNSSKKDRLPGNKPGYWKPKNPSPRAIQIMKELGTWDDLNG